MLPASTGNLPWNPNEWGKEDSTCPTTEAAVGAGGVTGPASSAAARALRRIGPLSGIPLVRTMKGNTDTYIVWNEDV